ncbi:hypothetical protein Rsub_07111 [Raphidocelis subcapitata]|uniref:Uncharacterized protein n=1 Tax=Raphidocelis subcapitata TaxID=307507 RepID=A0A2V0P2M1_9CHLO|nr:hypothetical protein Rsub_07111 [Raphidocelis subcapitata]|eukprot:GBF94124.1 hypothetical protein Rsub_07111 [Raphidocelis subcapitata]
MCTGHCYWGTQTRPNKIAWGFVCSMVLIGAGFWIPGIITTRGCLADYYECDSSLQDRDSAAGTRDALACVARYKSCITVPAIIWAVGWLFLVLSWLPCTYFCCCSRGPHAPPSPSARGLSTPAFGSAPHSSSGGSSTSRGAYAGSTPRAYISPRAPPGHYKPSQGSGSPRAPRAGGPPRGPFSADGAPRVPRSSNGSPRAHHAHGSPRAPHPSRSAPGGYAAGAMQPPVPAHMPRPSRP